MDKEKIKSTLASIALGAAFTISAATIVGVNLKLEKDWNEKWSRFFPRPETYARPAPEAPYAPRVAPSSRPSKPSIP